MKLLDCFICAAAAAALAISCNNTPRHGVTSSSGSLPAVPVAAASDGITGEEDPDTPVIKLLSKGSILPSTGNMDLLFGAASFAGAHVSVKEIHTGNILQFMQYDKWETRYELYRVATEIADTNIVLGARDAAHIREYKTYALSLDELIKREPGAIYHVEINGTDPLAEGWYGNPVSVDLIASDLALIAKRGDRDCEVFAFDILSGKPVSGARIKLYDFVQQELAKGQTDADGHVSFKGVADARFVTANSGKNYAYLDLKNEKSLSTSNFDVSGTNRSGGLKAYIFGERGVWRPGDTLHVSVITMNDGLQIPEGHPVVAELRNPDGQVVSSRTLPAVKSGIYHFPFVTENDAPTGRWQACVTIGGQTFNKTLRIESVKPNNLDISLKFGEGCIGARTNNLGTVSVNWLYGAPGADLKVNGDLNLSSAVTTFPGYADYDFEDDTRQFAGQGFRYNDMRTGADGSCNISTEIDVNKASTPGLLNAEFTIRAFEPSGEFSTVGETFRFSPFDRYVGMKTEMDKDEWGEEFIKAGVPHRFDVVTLDPDGKPLSVQGLHVEIWRVSWSWWWNSTSGTANYMSAEDKQLVYETSIATSRGKGSFSYDWSGFDGGLFYVKVSDVEGGHAAAMRCQVSDGDAAGEISDAASKLSLSLAGESYKVGETARVSFPSPAGSTAIVSVEKGGRILSADKVNCFAGSTEVQIPVTREMLPNAYVFVTLIQPHGNVANDAPIRLYGVCNIPVQDEKSHLAPVVAVPDEVKPESRMTVKVSEKDGRAMSYVLAVVDEGLLGLTGFKTPDAWQSFYAREALLTRTWDVYDDVIGAYGGHIEQLFAIGGDDEAGGVIKRHTADRFPPVVRYLGPFDLKAGRTASHNIDLPQYIGTVRVMVVATDGSAQGSASKDVAVTKPVMVKATLPRTLSVGETIRVPATLMTLRDGVGDVKLSVQAEGGLSVKGESARTVRADKAGQTVEYFELEAGERPGTGRVSVTARSGQESSVSSVEIDILNPNPATTRLQTYILEAGASQDVSAELFGLDGTNSLKVELSSIPAIDLQGRLRYLLDYPFGCVEQTVSAAFPQLYLDKVMDCSDEVVAISSRNVTSTISRLASFRHPDGSLSYWPGSSSVSSFGTVYALHFLQEAENVGYAVPAELKASLASYVSANVAGNRKENDFVRAYAMFALASAGKPQRSAMNNLRGKTVSNGAAWMLAAAYAADGKKDIATQIVTGLPYVETSDKVYSGCYGSEERNMAVALKTLTLLGDSTQAFELAASLAGRLNDSGTYMSTQSAAWSLYAVCDYARTMAGGGIDATVRFNGKNSKVGTKKHFAAVELLSGADGGNAALTISNSGSKPVHATVSRTGVPEAGSEQAVSSGLKLEVLYVDMEGNPVSVDTLSRGRMLRSVAKVVNTSPSAVNDIALAQKFPSGWEIGNERLYVEDFAYPAGVDYQDFRDDRVFSFFSLAPGASVTVTTRLTAAYPGSFYLPAVSCEAMYDASVSALVPGRKVEVF